ncbi:RNA-binding protein, partial [Candidatus Bathyarchaeota archaeon]
MSRGVKGLRSGLVFPGDKLAVIEEFLNGPGAYEEDGVVRSAELGDVKFDLERREVRVSKRTRTPILPVEGLD